MTRITTTWTSSQEVEAPEGMNDAEFRDRLEDGDPNAWDHALAQVDASTAELTDWNC